MICVSLFFAGIYGVFFYAIFKTLGTVIVAGIGIALIISLGLMIKHGLYLRKFLEETETHFDTSWR